MNPVNLQMKIKFCHGRRHVDRKRQRMHDDISTIEANMAEMNDTDDSTEKIYSRKALFYVLIDNVFTGITVRFSAVKKLVEDIDFLLKYPTMFENEP